MSATLLPYKRVGVVAGDGAPCLHVLGGVPFLAAPAGRAVHVWRADRLALALVTRAGPATITCVAPRGGVGAEGE